MLSSSTFTKSAFAERTKSGVCAQSGEFGIFNTVTHSRYIVFGIGDGCRFWLPIRPGAKMDEKLFSKRNNRGDMEGNR